MTTRWDMEFAGRQEREPCAYETLHLGPRTKTDRRVRLTAERDGVAVLEIWSWKLEVPGSSRALSLISPLCAPHPSCATRSALIHF